MRSRTGGVHVRVQSSTRRGTCESVEARGEGGCDLQLQPRSNVSYCMADSVTPCRRCILGRRDLFVAVLAHGSESRLYGMEALELEAISPTPWRRGIRDDR